MTATRSASVSSARASLCPRETCSLQPPLRCGCLPTSPTLAPKLLDYPPPPRKLVPSPCDGRVHQVLSAPSRAIPTTDRLGSRNRLNSTLTRSSSYPTASPPENQQLRGDQHSESKRPLDPRRRLFRPTLEARGAICARRAASAPGDRRLVPTPTRTPAAVAARRDPGVRGAPGPRLSGCLGVEQGRGVRETCKYTGSAASARCTRCGSFQAAPACAAQLETKARRRPGGLRPEKLQSRARLYLGTPTPGAPAALSPPAASLLALLSPSAEARALPG